MGNLDITQTNLAKMEKMEAKAIDIILDVLEGKREPDGVSKIASTSLSVVGRTRQTLTNRQAIGFSMASSIATPAELKKYVTVTAPKVLKALSGKTGQHRGD